MKQRSRVFGWVEAIFDILYLLAAIFIGLYLLFTAASTARLIAGCMALVLAFGDAFHLVPRVAAIFTKQEQRFSLAMGIGKLVASVTMTIFYVLLWHIGILLFSPTLWPGLQESLYVLAAIRIVLCLLPQNKWTDPNPPLSWSIYRNIPFIILGFLVAALFAFHTGDSQPMSGLWLSIVLSFAFYLPVVLFAHKRPKLGMLMLPKTCAYIYMLLLCLSL